MHRMVVSATFLFGFCLVVGGFNVDRRSVTHDRSADDYPDYQVGVKYDEYPMIVPKKRTAILMNRLMVALKDKIEEEVRKELEQDSNRIDFERISNSGEDYRTMDLQRRGHGLNGQQKNKVYWRCFFNAVTCF